MTTFILIALLLLCLVLYLDINQNEKGQKDIFNSFITLKKHQEKHFKMSEDIKNFVQESLIINNKQQKTILEILEKQKSQLEKIEKKNATPTESKGVDKD